MAAPLQLVVDDASELEPWLDTDLHTIDSLHLELRMRWLPSPEPLVAFLRAVGPLRKLSLSTEATLPLAAVEALATHDHLEELELTGRTPVRDPQMKVIAASFPRLQRLLVDNAVLSLEAYRALIAAPFQTTLRSLFVAFSSFSQTALDLLASTSWPALQELTISAQEEVAWDRVKRFEVAPVPLVLPQAALRAAALQMAENEPSRRIFTSLFEHAKQLDDSVFEAIASPLEQALSEWPDSERALLLPTASVPETLELDPRPCWTLVRELKCLAQTEHDAQRLLEGPPLSATSLTLSIDDLDLDLSARFPHLEALTLVHGGHRRWDVLRSMQLPPIQSLELEWHGDLFAKPSGVAGFREWIPESIQRVRLQGVSGREVDHWLGRADPKGWRHELRPHRPDYPTEPMR